MTTPPFPLVATRSALVIVDMQNDFVRAGAPMEVPDARTTIPVIQHLAEWFRAHDRPVVYTAFLAGPNPTLIWAWSPQLAPPVCACWKGHRRTYDDVEGERDGAAIVDELAPRPGEPVIEKYSYDAFRRTPLADHLRARDVDTVVLAGTVTQICVDETGRGAFDDGFHAVIVSDAASSYDDELHRTTLRNFAMKWGRALTSDEVLHEMEGA